MPKLKSIRNTLVAGAVVALTACASAGASPGGGGPVSSSGEGSLALRIINDVVPPTTVTVYMVPETGGRRRLGSISPNATQTFNIDPGLRSMEYHFVAEMSGESDKESNPFVPENISTVEWRVSSVIIRTSR